MPKDNPRRRSARKHPTAAHITPPRPVRHQKERDAFTSLPDELVTLILGLLDRPDRINMQSTCRRLKTLVNWGPWMSRIHFTNNDLPTAFTAVMVYLRSDAIKELDVSHYVVANSHRLAEGIKLCKNLTVLRCVQSCLQPAALFLLLRNHLRRLEGLYWSVLEPLDRFLPHPYGATHFATHDVECSLVPVTLTHMYVEAVNEPASIGFVDEALRHFHGLRSLHFHERESKNKVYGVASRILYALRCATLDNFDQITYTRENAPNYAILPAYPLALGRHIFGDFEGYVEVYKNVTLKLKPQRSCNCVRLGELESTTGIKSHTQLTVLIAEDEREMTSHLLSAAFNGVCGHLKALVLTSPLETGKMFRYKNIRNQAALFNFITSCVALTELNISAFHFSLYFNCCSKIANGGLHNLRSLALAACALSNPRRLEHLSQAPFELRELDVRSGLSRATCDICELDSTSDDASLASLRLLRHLTRLTLCELGHARSLDFLVGCTSLWDLRLRNMGMWRGGCHQDMSPIAVLWTQLHTLKLASVFSPIDFTFIRNVPVSPTLSRLCLGSVMPAGFAKNLLPSKLKPICPSANVIHLHAWYMKPDIEDDLFVLNIPFERGDRLEGNIRALLISSANQAWLCACFNTIGVPKQYGII